MSKEILEVEAEEVQNFEVALNKAVVNEVARLDKYELRIKELQDKYKDVSITDASDREGYDKSLEAWREIKSIRINTDKERKAVKAPLLAAGKSIEAKAQWIMTEIEKIEKPIADKIDWYEQEKEKEKQARIEKENKQYQIRYAQLKAFGADSDGVSMILDEETIDLAMLRSVHEEIYVSKILPKFTVIFDTKEKIRIANEEAQKMAEELKRKEKEELLRQQEELRQAQQKLKEEQDNAAKKEREAESERIRIEKAKENLRMTTRYNQMQELGLKFDFASNYFVNFDVFIHTLDITGYDDEKWNDTITKTAKHIEEWKKQDEEKKAEQQRILNEEAIAAGLRKKAQDEELERQREREELEALKDSEKWAFYLKELFKVKPPIMNHSRYKTLMKKAADLLNQIKSLHPNNK